MIKTMRFIFAVTLIFFIADILRPVATNETLIGEWQGISGDEFVFHPSGVVEFHGSFSAFQDDIVNEDVGDLHNYFKEQGIEGDKSSSENLKHVFSGRYVIAKQGKFLHKLDKFLPLDIQWLDVDGHVIPQNLIMKPTSLIALFDYRTWKYQIYWDDYGGEEHHYSKR